jgi:hypothetical protein
MLKNKLIDLYPCKCCGNLLVIHITKSFIDISCSDKSITDPCINHKSNCENENMNCLLIDDLIIQQEDILFDHIIILITDILRDNRKGDCFLKFKSERIQTLFDNFPKEWQHGKLEDKSGIYYRIFKSEAIYKKALIKHAKKFGLTPQMQLEFYRLGLN